MDKFLDILQNSIYYLIVINAFICGCFSGWLGDEKGRGFGKWFVLGIIFGEFALLSIGLSPSLKVENKLQCILVEIQKKNQLYKEIFKEKL